MINQKRCPFCQTPALKGCEHLALAAEGRDFVRQCVDACHGQAQWAVLCRQRLERQHLVESTSVANDDFTWLETAFCEDFLKHLTWFGGMDHEWRSGPKPQYGGFWVLLWSKNPQKLWWALREEFERHCQLPIPSQTTDPWLIWLAPK
jgi:hypothetical protein